MNENRFHIPDPKLHFAVEGKQDWRISWRINIELCLMLVTVL